MRFTSLFFIAWLVAGVAGAGRRVSYEKIMMYHAFLIEESLNLPMDKRRIAVKCTLRPAYKDAPCPDTVPPQEKFQHCRYSYREYDRALGRAVQKNKPCEWFWEFMGWIDGGDRRGSRFVAPRAGASQNTVDFDPNYAAERIALENHDQNRVPPWVYYKDGSEPRLSALDKDGREIRTYNGFLESMFEHMGNLKATMTPAQYAAVSDRFDDMETSRALLSTARQADTDYHWMKMISDNDPTIRIEYRDLNYIDARGTKDERPARIYNHEATMARIPGDWFPHHAELRLLREKYLASEKRIEHVEVIRRLENGGQSLANTAVGCRR